ncbi:hypothetical protein ACFYU8_17870 [Brevibacillus sp. NPDC003359]|uniref:hypothetical protein n=1 Tax=unclassified Brevibacillus TaxID=2684853 RepID=UPI0036878267
MSNIVKFPQYIIVGEHDKAISEDVLIFEDWYFSFSNIPIPIIAVCKDIPAHGLSIHDVFTQLQEKYPFLKNRVKIQVDVIKRVLKISLLSQENCKEINDGELENVPASTDTDSNHKKEEITGGRIEDIESDDRHEKAKSIQDREEITSDKTGQFSLFNSEAILAPKQANGQFMLDLFSDDSKNDYVEESCPEECSSVQDKSKKNLKPKERGTRQTSKNLDIRIEDGDWKIAYAAHVFHVVEFFGGTIPEAGVSTEEVRVKLEEEFPEFSKERTFWECDKDKKILFPVIRGTSKGAALL